MTQIPKKTAERNDTMPRLDHWDRHAANWHLVGAPLRPSDVDVRIFERIASNAPRVGFELEAVLLGATEEIVSMNWPTNTRLQVIERNPAMLARLTSSVCVDGPEVVVQQFGDWRSMSVFAQCSQDLVLGDGCFTTLSSTEYDRVLDEVYRVLRPGGVFGHRFFVQQDPQETPFDVVQSWPVTSMMFHAQKLRLLMALQKSFEEGVSVHAAWEVWDEHLADEVSETTDELAKTIEAYRDSKARYTFPTATELKAKLMKRFNVELVSTPHGYWLSERCPIVMCIRKDPNG